MSVPAQQELDLVAVFDAILMGIGKVDVRLVLSGTEHILIFWPSVNWLSVN